MKKKFIQNAKIFYFFVPQKNLKHFQKIIKIYN
jgi:hypothetical protein